MAATPANYIQKCYPRRLVENEPCVQPTFLVRADRRCRDSRLRLSSDHLLEGGAAAPPPIAVSAAKNYVERTRQAYRSAVGAQISIPPAAMNPGPTSPPTPRRLILQPTFSQLCSMQRRLEVWQCPPEASLILLREYLNKVQKHEDQLPENKWSSYTAAHFPNKFKSHTKDKIMLFVRE